MSENVVINDTTYNGVDALALVRADGTVATFFPDAVRYNAQTLTDAQKAQARQNIGAQPEGDYLESTALPAAINTALAQAKASGEFDGENGLRGTGLLPVTTAPSSYTTEVGGITPKYRMAISTIKTQAGVTEVLLGDTVRYSYYHYPIAYLDASYAYFTTRVSIRGAAGTTPVRGTDYWTEADQEAIVQQVITALGTPVFGRVDENKVITFDTKHLVDGAYTCGYEDENGNFVVIGNLAKGVTYTNVLAQAIDESGAVLNGVGYRDGYRFSNYAGDLDQDTAGTTGFFATGFMPYTNNQVKQKVPLYIKGISLDLTALPSYLRFTQCIPGSTEWFGVCNLSTSEKENNFTITQLGDKYYKFTPNANLWGYQDWDSKGLIHARFTLPGTGAGVIITIDEPIE